jgi:DNA modification methylase
VPRFFIEMLTEPGDLVIDPFAGSNVTGQVAESSGRRWFSVEIDRDYLEGSAVRFENLQAEISEQPGRARKIA